jgi:hypothetical protein
MNPYSVDLVPEPKQRSRWFTAKRVAFGANVICCLHLAFLFCWMIYDVLYVEHSGCFTGDGLAELTALTISFLFFWVSAMIAGTVARSLNLVLTTILMPVLSLFLFDLVANYL